MWNCQFLNHSLVRSSLARVSNRVSCGGFRIESFDFRKFDGIWEPSSSTLERSFLVVCCPGISRIICLVFRMMKNFVLREQGRSSKLVIASSTVELMRKNSMLFMNGLRIGRINDNSPSLEESPVEKNFAINMGYQIQVCQKSYQKGYLSGY